MKLIHRTLRRLSNKELVDLTEPDYGDHGEQRHQLEREIDRRARGRKKGVEECTKPA